MTERSWTATNDSFRARGRARQQRTGGSLPAPPLSSRAVALLLRADPRNSLASIRPLHLAICETAPSAAVDLPSSTRGYPELASTSWAPLSGSSRGPPYCGRRRDGCFAQEAAAPPGVERAACSGRKRSRWDSGWAASVSAGDLYTFLSKVGQEWPAYGLAALARQHPCRGGHDPRGGPCSLGATT